MLTSSLGTCVSHVNGICVYILYLAYIHYNKWFLSSVTYFLIHAHNSITYVIHSFIHLFNIYCFIINLSTACLELGWMTRPQSGIRQTSSVPVLTTLQNSKANTEGGTMKTLSVNHPVMSVRNEGHLKTSPQFGMRNLWRTGHLSRRSWGLQRISCSLPSVAILDRCVPRWQTGRTFGSN